ncbi:MAG: glycosyltransferase [Phycisphaerae bacterium]
MTANEGQVGGEGTTNAVGVGVVVIGRNEGERFRRCVMSLVGDVGAGGIRPPTGPGLTVVYVDSGSTDGSQQFAKDAGVEVVALDMSTAFTAARARNAGLARLLEIAPHVEFVQFVDGDCEVHANWLAAGAAALRAEEKFAAVSGRLRERFPEQSLYNKLADIEWDRPIGLENSCGGNAMFRVRALQEVGGYDATLIAGEEPELCARLRAKGWLIRRIADEMALHDLAMFKQKQWLTRAKRHGFAMLEVSRFRTAASRGLFSQQMRSAVIWGLAIPAVMWAFAISFMLCVLTGGLYLVRNWLLPVGELAPKPADRVLEWLAFVTAAAVLILVVPATLLSLLTIAQWLRLAARARREKPLSWGEALLYSRLLLASKGANVRGMLQMLVRRWRKGPTKLIDYKTQATA